MIGMSEGLSAGFWLALGAYFALLLVAIGIALIFIAILMIKNYREKRRRNTEMKSPYGNLSLVNKR
jgi:hypothetical protein